MAIRLRRVNGTLIAICAACSVPKSGDIYLDDEAHGALSDKFARDFNENKLWEGGEIPFDSDAVSLVEQEENNNPAREWWDKTYGDERR
jgi:hypothetical protein